jgi:hypothetical protein
MSIAVQRLRQRLTRSLLGPAGRASRRVPLTLVVLVLASFLGAVAPCPAAGLVIVAPNISALPGSSGSFDVLLVNTDPAGTAGYDIAGDSLELLLSGSAGSSIQFTNATINTVAAPYIFTQSVDNNNGFPLFTNSLPSSSLMTSDSGDPVNGYPGFTTVNPGDTFGLANVSYSVSAGATLGTSDAITFVLTNGATSLSVPDGTGITPGVQNGSITVGFPIPEPATLTLATIAALVALAGRVASGLAGRRGIVGALLGRG